MKEKRFPIIRPNIPHYDEWIKHLDKVYESGIFTNGGELARKVEQITSERFSSNCSTYLCSSNTNGLIATLISFNVRNQLVAVSNFTFPATMQAIILAGGIPVVIDVEDTTWEISHSNLENALGQFPNIHTLVFTRVFGFNRKNSKLLDYCQKKSINIVMDSAAAFPAGKNIFKVEQQVEVYSFHATKPFGVGEGGLVVADNERISKIRKISNFGFEANREKFSDGLNAKADEFMAARVLARLENYQESVTKRNLFASKLKSIFDTYTDIQTPSETGECSWSFYPIRFLKEDQLNKFIFKIENTIGFRKYYWPTIKEGYVGNANIFFADDLSVSNEISNQIICLPVYDHLEENDLEIFLSMIIDALQ
jgi:dTDP-4-amino-4,6-dideoxygalactose transaminase